MVDRGRAACLGTTPRPDRTRTGSRTDSTAGTSGIVERIVFTGAAFNVFIRLVSGLEVRAAVPEGALSGIEPGAAVDLRWSRGDVIVVEDDSGARS